MLLDFQRKNSLKIKDAFTFYSTVQIAGQDGEGRMYTVESLNNEYFVVAIKNANNDQTLAPLKNALYNLKKLLISNEIKMSLGVSINALFVGIDFETNNIFEDEDKFIKTLNKLRRHKSLIIVFNYSELNPSIKHILDNLKKDNPTRILRKLNPIYYVYLTRNQNELSGIININFDKLSVDAQNARSILKDLELNADISDNLSQDEIEFIFNITNNNIILLKEIVKNLNCRYLSFSNCRDDNNSIIRILNKCFKDETQRIATEEMLAYCSYSEDFELTKFDLEFLLNINITDVTRYIDKAEENKLVIVRNDKILILISLLKKLYKDQFEMRKGAIYTQLCKMISEMYPSNYKQKTFYAVSANDDFADIYFTQYCMQEIRQKGICSSNYLARPNFKYGKLVDDYRIAQSYFYSRNYKEIIMLCNSIVELPAVLDTELKLLTCQAYMKSLDESDRNTALKIVNSINEMDLDGNLKYRLCISKIIANIHTGNYREAFTVYNSIVQEINNKRHRHKSSELDIIYFTLLRKNNMVNNYQSSVLFMEQAKEFFKAQKDLPKSYYLSIVNCLGIHLKNYDLVNAEKDISEMEILKTEYYTLKFPREYIFKNNRLIFDYFKKTSCTDILKGFETLYNGLSFFADKFLVANNYAVFMALNNDVKGALSFIQECKKKYNEPKEDSEGIYNYKYKVNTSIFKYIIDNTKAKEIIIDLSKIDFDINYPNRHALLQEVRLIIKNMEKPCNSVNEWLENFKQLLPSYRPSNGFELGFVITELFSWDDD